MVTPDSAQVDAASIFRLPDPVLESIIGRLRTHHRANLRGACRKFRTLVNNTVLKIKLDPTYSDDALQWQLSARFPRLEHLEVMKPSHVDCFTDQAFAQLALKDLSRLTGLTSLNLENCTQMTVAGMAALALACPTISKLVIPQICQLCMSDTTLMVLARLPELNKLRLQCCKHCDEVALAYLSDLKRLTALELEDYGQALRQVTQLTSLTSLRSVMVWSDYTLDVTDHGPHAQHGGGDGAHGGGGGGGPGGVAGVPAGGHAGAGGGHHGGHGGGGGGHGHHPPGGVGLGHHHQGPAGGPGVAAAAAAPPAGINQIMAAAEVAAAAVANLNLMHQADVAAAVAAAAAEVAGDGAEDDDGAAGNGNGAAALAAVAAAAAAAINNVDAAFVHQLQLTEQVLSNIFEGKHALLDWVTGMTGLTHVDIQRVDIAAGEVQRFAALPGLVHLGVGDLNLEPGVGDPRNPLPSVSKLVSHNILHEAQLRTTFPSLRALSCDSSDSGLAHIAELTGLVNLFLWTSPLDSITDSGLAALSGLQRLETFRLEGSDTVTNSGWVAFARKHSALTRIDIVKCPLVSNIGFILSIPMLTHLRRVSFVDCPGIDTPTLAALLGCCPDLEHLELQDCTAVTLASLRSLLASVSRPDLDLVYRKGGAMRTLHGVR